MSTDRIVMSAIACRFGVTMSEMRSSQRDRHIVTARHAAMYALREVLGLSYPSIGAAMHRDHSTVMHAVDKIRFRLTVDADMKVMVSDAMDHARAGLDDYRRRHLVRLGAH